MSTAFIFPGQGSQSVGMGKALYETFPSSRFIFEEVDEALEQKLTKLMFEGPIEELTLTANAQPALMAVSMAALRALEAEKGVDLERDVAFVAGHSLGEYSALAAASALTVRDTALLLRIRGNAMQRAVPAGVGGMAALIGATKEQAIEVAAEAAQGEVCELANDNGGGQVVISGHKTAIERAIPIAQAKGIRRAMPLPVSAPFHCSLMQPAAEEMLEALDAANIHHPKIPLVANVIAAATSDPEEIRRRLVEQVTGSVRWAESMAWLGGQGVTRFVEIGAGKVLSGLVKRIVDGATASNIGTPDDVNGFVG